MPGEVIVTIDPKTNEVFVEVKGMKGRTCKDVTKLLEDALGNVKSERMKPEYYDNSEARASQNAKR